MAKITFTIPDEKLDTVIETMIWFFPIPQINTGTEEEPVFENEFTDAQWAKEAVRRWIIKQAARRERRLAQDAINIVEDDDLIS